MLARKKTESCQCLQSCRADWRSPPPDGCVQHTVGGEVYLAVLPQVLGTVLPVVLELGQAGVDGVGDTDPAQTGEGKVVVKEKDQGGVEDTLDILT